MCINETPFRLLTLVGKIFKLCGLVKNVKSQIL